MSNWTITEKENSKGELTVTLSGERWLKAQEKAFNEIAKEVEIKGFRKGQAPKALVEKQVSEGLILSEAVNEIANDLLQEGIKEHDLWPVDRPELSVNAISKQEVEMVFTIIVKPEVELGEYKGLNYEIEDVEISNEKVDAEIERMRQNYAEITVKEDAAEDGDIVVIDFEGFKDGVAFEGGKAEGHELKLGSNSFIPGFESQLIGTKAGDSKDVELSFPEDYHVEDLKGAPVVFKVTVHEVKETILPEVNDDFAQDLNIPEVETVEQLKERIKSDMENQEKDKAENEALDKLLTEVVDNASVNIPQRMIEDETDQMIQEFAQRLQQQNFGLNQFLQMTNQSIDDIRSQFEIDATSKVKLRLVLETIADKENLVADEDAINDEYQKIADQYQMELDKVKELIPAESLEYDVKMRKALDFVKDSAIK
ncbi:MAG: trigger factor [Erysipelotrichaceae bacterium]|jgi:trigger factor|nr:trigger factor [Bacillota bacterium]NLP22631.1 trigger factor [Erysipelotrichaceae bacterium]